MLEPEFLDLFKQAITRHPATGVNAYGQRTTGAGEEVLCHIQGGKTEVTTPDGETAIAEGAAWMAHHATMSTADEITLPGETRRRHIITVATAYDEDGPHHTKITSGG
jgi:hypothetical protein